jgi:tripeptide aminopeptidase
MLPRNESPEATDGLYGNYWPNDFTGGLEKAELQVMIRDFDLKNMERRLQAIEHFALAVDAAFPGGKVILKKEKQYLNMLEAISKQPFIMENLQKAMELNDILPIRRPIRGGTDGSRLSEMGIPTPNVFAGGYNFHSRTEWVAQEAMGKACNVLLSLINIWANVP